MFIDDCIKGTELIMRTAGRAAAHLGSDQLVTINQLVDIVESIAGVKVLAGISWRRRKECADAIATTP